MKECPACGEQIQDSARKCPHCGEESGLRSGSNRGGLWAVIVILGGGLLIFVFVCLLPLFQSRARHRRLVCTNNLKQMGLALHNYHSVYNSFPPAYVVDDNGRPMHSWRVLLLPFLDEFDLYDQYDFTQPWDSPVNQRVLDNMPDVYACPSDHDGNTTNYAAVFGPNCVFSGSEPVRIRDITDGTPNTLFIGEVDGGRIPWTKPEDIDISLHPGLTDSAGFQSEHAEYISFLQGDGGVRLIDVNIQEQTLLNLFTRNDGDSAPDF